MKLPAHQVERFCVEPPPEVRAVLLYGPDEGLVAERFDRLSAALAPDLHDPFQVVSLDGEEIAADSASFLDETAQISFDGTKRVIRVRRAGDSVMSALDAYLESDGDDAIVLVQGGDLGPRSGLRRLFESADRAVAAPCYADDSHTVEALLRAAERQHDLRIDQDAFAYLVERLGRDRGVTRSEVEKLVLFAGRGGTISYETAAALSGDNALLGADALADAAGLGQTADVFRALARLAEEGLGEVAVLRRLLRHFQRLHMVASTPDPVKAVRGLRPPVHFKRVRAMEEQARNLRPQRIEQVLELLGRAEQRCKRTGIPTQAIMQEAVLRIARIAAR